MNDLTEEQARRPTHTLTPWPHTHYSHQCIDSKHQHQITDSPERGERLPAAGFPLIPEQSQCTAVGKIAAQPAVAPITPAVLARRASLRDVRILQTLYGLFG